MAADRTIRAAVIGYGLAGAVFHAPLIAATEGMEVAAIVTSDDARREQARREHPHAELVAHADDLWADAAGYDLVVVAAANRAHADLALAAMAAGRAVVVDKPMAATSEDARSMVDAARSAGVVLSAFHNRRWDSDFLTVRRLVEDGAIGTPLRLESRFERFRAAPHEGAWREQPGQADAGGVLWDLGPHLIDQACVLFGEPTHVYAEVDVRRPGARVDDDAFVALRFAGGGVAHLWMSATAAMPGPRMKISGLRGAYEQRPLDPQEAALRAGKRPGDARWGRAAGDSGLLSRPGSDEPESAVEPLPGAWERYYAGIRDALLHGAAPPVSADDGARAVALVEAAHRSARSRQVLQLSA